MTSHEETWTVVEWDGRLRWRSASGVLRDYVGTGAFGGFYAPWSYRAGTVLRIITRVEIVEP